MGGDQDDEPAGLIRCVKASSLVDMTEMSGAVGAVVERRTKRAYCFPRKVSERPLEVEVEDTGDGGVCGEEDGATELEGERTVCIKYSISSSQYLELNWTQTKISSVEYRREENSRRMWNMIIVITYRISSRAAASVQLAPYFTNWNRWKTRKK